MMTSAYIDLIIALLLGTCLGLERSYAGKTAGMRTYALVAMGACLFILLSRMVAPISVIGAFDQMRTLAGIIMGIGFIGGGAILHNKDHTSGLTTAAGLWVAAGIGATVGYGFESLAILTTIATLVVFTFFWFIEHVMFHMEENQNKKWTDENKK